MMSFDGWINIYKSKNITSFGVVNKIKLKFKPNKVGHAGTLDPNAEGVLPIAINKSTKLISLIYEKNKVYEFEIKWGEQTDTDDQDGKIIALSKNIPSIESIKENLNFFIGEIYQIPPKVSAVKINGERAYKMFRNNELFELKERLVKVYNINHLKKTYNNISKFRIECGKGFYIRSFARDLANNLNTKAHICSLKRIKVGNFDQNNSILLDDLLKISQMDFGIKGFHHSKSVLDDIPAFEIENSEMLNNISQGKKVKMNENFIKLLIQKDKKNLFATYKGKIVSLGKLDGVFFIPKKVLL